MIYSSNRNPLLLKFCLAGWALFAAALVIASALADDPNDQQISAAADARAANLTIVDVVVAKPASSFDEVRRFSGLIESRRTSTLSFERVGRLANVLVDEGDDVKADQVLAELATDKLQAERSKLIADKDVRQAELDELIAGPRREQIDAAKARLEQAEALLDQAIKNLRRREQLISKQLISAEAMETARSGADSAAASMRSLKQELLELENGTRIEQVVAKRAQIKAVEAAIEVVDADLDNSKIKAPFAGTVVARDLDEGTIVASGQNVLELAETTHLQARFGIPSGSGKAIAVGKKVDMEINNKVVSGKVKALVSRVAQATRTQTLLVAFDNSKSLAYDGQVARLLLRESKQIAGFELPRSSLTRGTRGLWNCYVASGEDKSQRIIERRIVEVVRTMDNKVIVKGDLADGEWVVASAPHRVTAQQKVRIQKASAVEDSSSGAK